MPNFDTFLQVVLALIMFAVGLSLRLSDFGYVLAHRRLLALGLGIKLVLVPLLGFALLSLTTLPAVWQFGIMLLLFCPGGTTSNVITYWAGGTAALTIFLTVLSGIATIFTLPVFVGQTALYYFGESTDFELPVWGTIVSILQIILLPTLLGLGLRTWHPVLAVSLERWIKPLSVGLLGVVYVWKFVAPAGSDAGTPLSWTDAVALLPILLVIHAGGMLLAYAISRYMGAALRDGMTIGIEMGIQNAGLAILVSNVFLHDPDLSKPALLYALFSFWTTGIFAFVVGKRLHSVGKKTV